jgi:hypothetical protein
LILKNKLSKFEKKTKKRFVKYGMPSKFYCQTKIKLVMLEAKFWRYNKPSESGISRYYLLIVKSLRYASSLAVPTS